MTTTTKLAVATRNMTARRTTSMATSFFDVATNLVVRCIPGRERGGDFNDDNEEDEDAGRGVRKTRDNNEGG